MTTFRGIVIKTDTGYLLDAGGVRVTLEGDNEILKAFDGSLITLTGTQEGTVIHGVVPMAILEATKERTSVPAIIEVVRANQERVMSISGVFGIRPGFAKGSSDDTSPLIVIVTKPGADLSPIPDRIDDIPVDIQQATPQELREGLLPLSMWEGLLPEGAPAIRYTPPDQSEVKLEEMLVRNITCHVGPDSGWGTLKPFLQATNRSLTVAMYEFYAEHIIRVITTLGSETDATLNMILHLSSNDKEIRSELASSWQQRLDFVPAVVSGSQRIFANSYHTKVAVRDSSAFWLSSGNWSPTSQPAITSANDKFLYKRGNREWHVVIEDKPLAEMYEKFILYDMRKAREATLPEAAQVLPDLMIPYDFAEPEAAVIQDYPFVAKTFATNGVAIRVKPLMSPDNYAEEVLNLIESARHSLYLQFSYIREPLTSVFNQIVNSIGRKMEDGLDVRVLVGRNQRADHSDLLLGTRGWKRSMFRQQTSQLHNKGILIDGNIAVVGSNNWSGDGLQFNRDTSLVFFSRAIAQYYTEVFLFDWNYLSKPITSRPEIVPLLAPETGPTPLGMIRLPWQAWYDE